MDILYIIRIDYRILAHSMSGLDVELVINKPRTEGKNADLWLVIKTECEARGLSLRQGKKNSAHS